MESFLSRTSRAPLALVLASVIGLVVRLAYIALFADFDGDAYAHFEFACHVHPHPADLSVHWIWLPGFHFLLAAMQAVGFSFRAVRIFVAFLDLLAPWLLLRYAGARRRGGTPTPTPTPTPTSPRIAEHAALLLAVSSLMNLLGTSALAEVPFTLAMLAAATMIDEDRPVLAGLALTIAATMRYEAWFVAAFLGVFWIVQVVRTRGVALHRTLLITAAIPSIAIVLYIVYRRFASVTDQGEWLWFIRETYRFTHMQRGLGTASPLFEYLWFPVILPFFVLGPALLLVPFGGRWRRASSLVPIALLSFLGLTYLGKGALGQARYLTVLFPFACLAIARGNDQFQKVRLPRIITTLTVLGTAIIFFVNTARSAKRRDEDLRAREDRANAICSIALKGPAASHDSP